MRSGASRPGRDEHAATDRAGADGGGLARGLATAICDCQPGERNREQILREPCSIERSPPGTTEERQTDRDCQEEGEREGGFSDVEPEQIRPVPLMCRSDSEPERGK
jgi:hypothetical protein